MYIVAIAWLYVTLMMALTEHSMTAGVLTFFFYGVFPLSIVLWLMATPGRRRARTLPKPVAKPGVESGAQRGVQDPDHPDAGGDQ